LAGADLRSARRAAPLLARAAAVSLSPLLEPRGFFSGEEEEECVFIGRRAAVCPNHPKDKKRKKIYSANCVYCTHTYTMHTVLMVFRVNFGSTVVEEYLAGNQSIS
jgi:hypothetical protein